MLARTNIDTLIELSLEEAQETADQAMRRRTSVAGIAPNGEIHCHIYPTSDTKRCFKLPPNIKAINLDVKALTVGSAFDLLLVNNEVVRIESPAIHSFDVQKQYPQGLRVLTAVVNQAAEGKNGVAIAISTAGGQEKLYSITSHTGMWQGQTEEDRKRVFNGLSAGDNVNIWIDDNEPKAMKGDNKVTDVKYCSVNYGLKSKLSPCNS
jgi:hypothetical protein